MDLRQRLDDHFEKAAPKAGRSKTPTPAVVPVQVQPGLNSPPQRKASSAALARMAWFAPWHEADALRDSNSLADGLDVQPSPRLAMQGVLDMEPVQLAPVVALSTSARLTQGRIS